MLPGLFAIDTVGAALAPPGSRNHDCVRIDTVGAYGNTPSGRYQSTPTTIREQRPFLRGKAQRTRVLPLAKRHPLTPALSRAGERGQK